MSPGRAVRVDRREALGRRQRATMSGKVAVSRLLAEATGETKRVGGGESRGRPKEAGQGVEAA